MSQVFQHSEGIILRVIPFRDYGNILSLLTPDAGLIKLIYHGSRSKSRGMQGLCIPLTKVEAVYREKGGEIFVCEEMRLIEPFSNLRQKLHHLEVACDLLHVVASSQLVGKPAPILYALLCFFLQKIPLTLFPLALSVSFRLKLLKHDGIVAFPFICPACGQELLSEAYPYADEVWCECHRPVGSGAWGQVELKQLYRLSEAQNFHEIYSEEVSSQLYSQVSSFFDSCIKNSS